MVENPDLKDAQVELQPLPPTAAEGGPAAGSASDDEEEFDRRFVKAKVCLSHFYLFVPTYF